MANLSIKDLSIPEELFLLSTDHAEGNTSGMHSSSFKLALAGSILMELALQNRIDTDTEKVIIESTEPTGSEILDIALIDMQLDASRRNINFWMNRLYEKHESFVDALLNVLIRKGLLKIENRKILWVFSAPKYPIRDREEVKDVKSRLRALIFSEEIPDLHDMVIISLLYNSGMLHFVLNHEERDQHRERIELIAKMDLIGQNIGKRIAQELNLAVAAMMGGGFVARQF